MKKLLASLILAVIIPAFAAADTVTPRLSLTEPSINSANWGTKINNNMGLIDTGVGVLSLTNSWTAVNNFASSTTFGAGVLTSTMNVDGSLGLANGLKASSATLTFGLIAASATITTLTATNIGPFSVSSMTVSSSATLPGARFETNIAPVISSATVSGSLTVNGAATLGMTGTTVSISSNAILAGATFYPNATVQMSSANINTAFFLKNIRPLNICQVQSASVNASSATAVTSFIPTTLSLSYTPLSASSTIYILVAGGLSTPGSGVNAEATIARGGTNLAGTDGICITNPATSIRVPCSMFIKDNYNSISATTYAVYVRTAGGAGTTTWTDAPSQSTLWVFEVCPN